MKNFHELVPDMAHKVRCLSGATPVKVASRLSLVATVSIRVGYLSEGSSLPPGDG